MSKGPKAIIVVCDSLRRDLLGSATPTLRKFAETATSFVSHRAIFPSATRVTSASIATGCTPGRHGLHGNMMALDDGEGPVAYSVGKPDFVDRLRKMTGRTLRCPTLAERVSDRGRAVIFSNVSPGAAYFQDPNGFGYVYHRAGSFGPGRVRLPDEQGLAISSGVAGDREMTERFCRHLRSREFSLLSVLWQSEPDWTAHHHPLGSPTHLAAIRSADDNVERVLNAVRLASVSEDELLMVICSDHGNETIRRQIDVNKELAKAGFKAEASSRDIVAASQGTAALIYFSRPALQKAADVVAYLNDQDWAGAVYAGEDLRKIGMEPEGGLWIAISMAASDGKNSFGVTGFSDLAVNPEYAEDVRGFGNHGGLGPNESQRPFLMIKGPGFAPGEVRSEPTSPLDIAPTVLRHLGLEVSGMDGMALQQ
ncbi:alkaline phosphatase family protein [Bradyrhizobium sp. 26S5]|uniref:alkaline phosphatase family protein n=1 Tax=Bradyrhizobium sp. 26S5 TaxID=3139729 RepID=UPI0030D41782